MAPRTFSAQYPTSRLTASILSTFSDLSAVRKHQSLIQAISPFLPDQTFFPTGPLNQDNDLLKQTTNRQAMTT
jgi:hypothetical protein